MGTLIMAGQLILALGILVTLHEFGHFWAARMFGIKVEKFYLFFDAWGFKLFKFKKGDTEYGVGWLPLGGYVKIAGMVDESLDKEQLKTEPQPWEFRSKPAWQRLIVMLGGIIMNLILGVFIASISLMYYGDKYVSIDEMNQNGGIVAYEYAQTLSFKNGDKIISVNGVKPTRFDALFGAEVLLKDKAVITVERNGALHEIQIPSDFADVISKKGRGVFIDYRRVPLVANVADSTPAKKAGLMSGDIIIGIDSVVVTYYDEIKPLLQERKEKDITVKVDRKGVLKVLNAKLDTSGRLGFELDYIAAGKKLIKTDYPGLFASVSMGTSRSIENLVNNAVGLWRVATGKIEPKNALQGPIAIASIFGAEWNWERFWGLTGLLSLILAFMNLLPIPALDGGHVVFLLIEMITGKPVSEKVLYVAQTIGMVILLMLMVFVFANDIIRLIFN